jgi:hypothetical protein
VHDDHSDGRPQPQEETVLTPRSPGAVAALAAAALLLSGCGDLSSDDVARTARAFATAEADPAARCALLSENTLAALVEDEGASCEDALPDIPVGSGDVVEVEVWGEEAQAKLSDDTLFLTRTSGGWRIAAAACRSQGPDLPYECQVEA